MKKLFGYELNEDVKILDKNPVEVHKFGQRLHGTEIVKINSEQIQALKDGKLLAFTDDEYATFLVFEKYCLGV